MGKTTNEIRRRIEIKEQRLNRELTQEEKDRIIRTVKAKVRRENFFRGAFLSLGILVGAGGHALLTDGNNKTNKQQTENQIDLEKEDDRKTFADSLKVNKDTLESDNKEQTKIRNDIQQEIEGLETSQEVLDYIKDIFLDEYNKQNEQNITKDELKFYKQREMQQVFKDTAENGDTIFRSGNSEENKVDTTAGVITAFIKNGEETIKQQIIDYHNNYKTVYSKNEQVDKYEDNLLVSVAPIIDAGIDWSVAMNQEGTSQEVKKEYKNRLIDAVTQYKTEKVNETLEISEQTEEQEH